MLKAGSGSIGAALVASSGERLPENPAIPDSSRARVTVETQRARVFSCFSDVPAEIEADSRTHHSLQQHPLSDRLLADQHHCEWLRADLNCRPWAYESPALTTELLSLTFLL